MTATVWPRSSSAAGQRGADPATSHDDDVHVCPSHEVAPRTVAAARMVTAWHDATRDGRPVRAAVIDVPQRLRWRRSWSSLPAWASEISASGCCWGASSAAPSWGRPCSRSGSRCRSSPATRCRRVGYAPDEIFLTLSVGGLACYSCSWKIGIAVALVMLAVIASYRQNVHAYPVRRRRLRGRDDQPRAARPGSTVASALLVDYVLTVAVSISSAAQYAAAAIDPLQGHEAMVAIVAVAVPDDDEPARGARSPGTAFAIPTYIFMVCDLRRWSSWGFVRYFFGDLPEVASCRLHDPRRRRARSRARRAARWSSCCCGRSRPGARR